MKAKVTLVVLLLFVVFGSMTIAAGYETLTPRAWLPSVSYGATPTSTPTPTPTPVCQCDSDRYNCSDFGTHVEAQACYDYCISQGAGDIHRLDSDNDGIACEGLP